MDIIMFALARWDGPYSSTSFSIASELARNNRVFYVDNPFTLKYALGNFSAPHVRSRFNRLLLRRRIYHTVSESLIAVTPPIVLPVNFLPDGFLYDRLSAINDAIIGRTLTRLVKDYNVKSPLFINSFNPFYLKSLPESLHARLRIYISVDDIRHSKHISKHGPRLEDEMIASSDISFTTARELKRLKSHLSPNVHYLPNAADVALFRKAADEELAKPADIADLQRPIVMYTGHVDPRVDFALLTKVIDELTGYDFVFIGPVSAPDETVNALKSRPNVRFTGRKALAALPAYLRHAACTLIPFVCNTLTRSIYPLKINEYLAAGKPVVSTPFSDEIQDFAKVISIADDPKLFASAIRSATADDSPEKIQQRLKFVEQNTWQARVKTFWEILATAGVNPDKP